MSRALIQRDIRGFVTVYKIITCNDGQKIARVSRWIKIDRSYNVSKRNANYDYCTDENGYHPYQSEFNPDNGVTLEYFRFRGCKYALERFYSFGSMMLPHGYMWEETDGLHWLSGCDMDGNIFDPIMIEIDDCGEMVRVYESPRQSFYVPKYQI